MNNEKQTTKKGEFLSKENSFDQIEIKIVNSAMAMKCGSVMCV